MPRRYVRKQRRPKGRYMRRRAGRGRPTPSAATTWSSRKSYRSNASGMTKAITGFPAKMTVTLPYIISGRVNPGVVAYNDQVIRLNGVYDPDFSGAGHQPRGFDQWSLVYTQYRVSRVDVNVLVRQRASHGINVRAIPNNQSAALGSDFNLGEFMAHTYLGQTASNTPPLQRKLRFHPHKVLGMSWQQYIGADTTGSLISTTPADECYLHLVVQQVDQATVLDFEYEVQVLYRVTFFDRANLAIS